MSVWNTNHITKAKWLQLILVPLQPPPLNALYRAKDLCPHSLLQQNTELGRGIGQGPDLLIITIENHDKAEAAKRSCTQHYSP